MWLISSPSPISSATTTRCLSLPDLPQYLNKARELTKQYQAGGAVAFDPFRELVHFVLSLTVMREDGGMLLQLGPRGRDRGNIVGWFGNDRVPLKDGRWLRILLQLYVDSQDGGKLKVEKSLFQYQLDEDAERWVFRYDYLRTPEDQHPASHVQIRGALSETAAVPVRGTLERVHFPTGRVGIEAVIRLLVEQFGVQTNELPEVWRPVLAETEQAFLKIARRNVSGPQA